MAELIGQNKRWSWLADFQTNRWRNLLVVGRAFLPIGKTKDPEKEKDGNGNLHFGSQIPFRCLPAGAGTARSSRAHAGTLIRKSRESRSPHSSGIRLLDDHRNPEIPCILGVETEFHVSGKPCGSIYCSDSDEISQNRHMLQRSSSVLSAIHMRFVAVIRYGEKNAR